VATFQGGARVVEESTTGLTDLFIEPTDSKGNLAPWLGDDWWRLAIERWGDGAVTLRIAPTPGVLLHPILVYQLEMVRRVAPAWRIVGHGYADDVATDEAVARLAHSPYHEVRFADQPRPHPSCPDGREPFAPLSELFGRIRREQQRSCDRGPILVRLPARDPYPS
jgi:hypothetical protein